MHSDLLLELTAVGLGPGDPQLITLKGRQAIEAADLVFVPSGRNGETSLALRIAQPWLVANQPVVALDLPMSRDSALLAAAWQSAADHIVAQLTVHARAANGIARGVYLLLGDPLLYGTFTPIQAELMHRYPQINVHVIPGVTSFAATAATVQQALASGSERVAIVPADASTDQAMLRRLLNDFHTIVLLKVGKVLPQLIAALEELDLLDTSIYAERVGLPEESIIRDLRILRGQERPYLSLLIVRRGEE